MTDRRDGHAALRVRVGQLEIFDPHPETRERDARDAAIRSAGFGPTRTFLSHAGPPAKHPWLTAAVLEQEAAIDAHEADPEAVFLASLADVRSDWSY